MIHNIKIIALLTSTKERRSSLAIFPINDNNIYFETHSCSCLLLSIDNLKKILPDVYSKFLNHKLIHLDKNNIVQTNKHHIDTINQLFFEIYEEQLLINKMAKLPTPLKISDLDTDAFLEHMKSALLKGLGIPRSYLGY